MQLFSLIIWLAAKTGPIRKTFFSSAGYPLSILQNPGPEKVFYFRPSGGYRVVQLGSYLPFIVDSWLKLQFQENFQGAPLTEWKEKALHQKFIPVSAPVPSYPIRRCLMPSIFLKPFSHYLNVILFHISYHPYQLYRILKGHWQRKIDFIFMLGPIYINIYIYIWLSRHKSKPSLPCF